MLLAKDCKEVQGEPKEPLPPLQYPLCFGSSLSLSKHAETADEKVQSGVFQTTTAIAHQWPHGLSEGSIL